MGKKICKQTKNQKTNKSTCLKKSTALSSERFSLTAFEGLEKKEIEISKFNLYK